jgi:hypothetical protein
MGAGCYHYRDFVGLCVFAILLLASARDVFHAKVKALFPGWIDAIAID